MVSKKSPSKKDTLSSKVKSSAQSFSSPSKKLSQKAIAPRSKLPQLSVVNVIEQISKLLREELHGLEKKKASGE